MLGVARVSPRRSKSLAKFALNAFATGPPVSDFTYSASEAKPSGRSPLTKFVASITRHALDSRHPAERVRDRRRRHRQEHRVRPGGVAAVAADLVHLVSRRPPDSREPAAEVAPPDRHDLHLALPG